MNEHLYINIVSGLFQAQVIKYLNSEKHFITKMTSAEEFRKFGYAMVDYIADYLENISDRPVKAPVERGYIFDLMPQNAPENGEDWKDLLEDVEKIVMPGITPWQSPHFHAYYPLGNSYPSIVAEMLSVRTVSI